MPQLQRGAGWPSMPTLLPRTALPSQLLCALLPCQWETFSARLGRMRVRASARGAGGQGGGGGGGKGQLRSRSPGHPTSLGTELAVVIRPFGGWLLVTGDVH